VVRVNADVGRLVWTVLHYLNALLHLVVLFTSEFSHNLFDVIFKI
jgi:hypothetical protein